MYTQISANKTKTFVIFALFLIIVIGLAWLISYAYDIDWLVPVAVGISVIQALVSYYSGDKIALAVSGAKPVTKSDNPYLYRIVENLSITAGLPAPAVYVIPDSAINAFATGRDPKHASVAVTTGAIERLANEELEGVLAHELSHVGNYDILVSTIAVVLVGTIALISDLFLRHMFYSRRRDNENSGGQFQAILMIVALVLAILAPLIASLLQLAVSRKREYLADASGALLTRYPEGLARALEAIGRDKEPLEVANKATAHLYFANPLKSYAGKINNLFSTHPPLADRIKRLRSMA